MKACHAEQALCACLADGEALGAKREEHLTALHHFGQDKKWKRWYAPEECVLRGIVQRSGWG
jgi:hypothetical protein